MSKFISSPLVWPFGNALKISKDGVCFGHFSRVKKEVIAMLKKLIKTIALLLIVGFVLHIVYYFFFPDVSSLKRNNPKKTAFMEYREDQWQSEGKKKKVQQRWVPLSQISPFAVKAVIIAEDDKFWRHEGFDFDAMQKAIEKDLQKKTFKVGGSTISQQLSKNLFLSPSKNPVRKVKEAILTWRLERSLSKKRIIELYMNVAEWGDGIFGIELAARRYFGKSASALSAQESARLAAVLPNPIRFNPVGDSRYVAARSERIYQIMVKRGIVIPEYEEMMNEQTEADAIPGSSPEEARKLEDQVKAWQKEAGEASKKPEDNGAEPSAAEPEKKPDAKPEKP